MANRKDYTTVLQFYNSLMQFFDNVPVSVDIKELYEVTFSGPDESASRVVPERGSWNTVILRKANTTVGELRKKLKPLTEKNPTAAIGLKTDAHSIIPLVSCIEVSVRTVETLLTETVMNPFLSEEDFVTLLNERKVTSIDDVLALVDKHMSHYDEPIELVLLDGTWYMMEQMWELFPRLQNEDNWDSLFEEQEDDDGRVCIRRPLGSLDMLTKYFGPTVNPITDFLKEVNEKKTDTGGETDAGRKTDAGGEIAISPPAPVVALEAFDTARNLHVVKGTDFIVTPLELATQGKKLLLLGVRTTESSGVFSMRMPTSDEKTSAGNLGVTLLDDYGTVSQPETSTLTSKALLSSSLTQMYK